MGSTTMHLAHAYLNDWLDVSVINPRPLTYKIVEALFGLGLSHSRQIYKNTIVRVDDMIRGMVAAGKGIP